MFSRAFAPVLFVPARRLVHQCTVSIFPALVSGRGRRKSRYIKYIGSIYSRRINAGLESQCIYSHYLKRQNALQALVQCLKTSR